jgi:hypothetical protein
MDVERQTIERDDFTRGLFVLSSRDKSSTRGQRWR